MMINEDSSDVAYRIRAVDSGSVTINTTCYSKSLIVSPSKLIAAWPVDTLEALTPAAWDAVIALKPEVVILGVGNRFALVKPALLQPLYDADLGVECMDTAAAARTYAALSSEGRIVVAALIINTL